MMVNIHRQGVDLYANSPLVGSFSFLSSTFCEMSKFGRCMLWAIVNSYFFRNFMSCKTCFRGSVNFIRFGSILHGSHLHIAWGIAHYYQIVQVIKLKEIRANHLPRKLRKGCYHEWLGSLLAILGTNFAIVDHALNFTAETWPPNKSLYTFPVLHYFLVP